jgi:small-conductance mechanosensitive channel
MGMIIFSDLPQASEPCLRAILVFIIAIFVINIISRVARKILANTVLLPDAQNILRRIVKYVLWFVVLMYIIAELNLKELLMPLMGATVLVAAAIALAVKNVLSDVIAGIFILLDHDFDIGDEVETMGHRGEIIDVTLRKTRIRKEDGVTVVLPNGRIDSSGWVLHVKMSGHATPGQT